MELMTTYQAAKKWNITPRRVEILCSQNRIEGAFKFGGNWAIPVDTSKPDDKRKKVNGGKTENA